MPATRRGFLLAAGAAALPMAAGPAEDELTTIGHRLLGLLSGTDAAHHVARTYLSEIGGLDWRHAVQDLDMPVTLAPIAEIADADTLRKWLGARIREDFAAGAAIDVAGWRLSRTEVGACVLAFGVARDAG